MTSFMQRVLAGKVVDFDVEVDDAIADWHARLGQAADGQATTIYDHLGMTREEYAVFVEKPTSLTAIIAHRFALRAASLQLMEEALTARLDRLQRVEDTLRWYANPDHYQHPCTPECCDVGTNIDVDRGLRARTALDGPPVTYCHTCELRHGLDVHEGAVFVVARQADQTFTYLSGVEKNGIDTTVCREAWVFPTVQEARRTVLQLQNIDVLDPTGPCWLEIITDLRAFEAQPDTW